MNKTKTKGEQTHDGIVDAAHSLFVKQGYHGTSMRQIALDANIALGGIYNHFKNKEEIFREVFFAYHPYNDVLPALESIEGSTIEEIVHDGALRMVDAFNARPDFLNLMFIEYVEFKNVHTKELVDIVVPRGMNIIKQLKDSKGKLRDIPLPIFIRAFIGFFLSYYLTDVMMHEWSYEAFKEKAMEHFIMIFLHGVLSDE
ncbi:MAG TPA: TetR/AcrR family transcriptional regulator [Anaerolineae bacterium]|nr:TetR/AcrR family transcriptional regulator [Anaerolineae bacterium]